MDKKAHWKRIEISRKPLVTYARGQFESVLKSLIKPYSDKLKDPEYSKMIEHDIHFPHEDMHKAFERVYVKTGMYFAKKTRQELLRTKSNYPQDAHFESAIKDFALNKAGSRITTVVKSAEDEALKIIRGILEQGASEGWGIGRIAQEMRDALNMGYSYYADYASVRIARTEVSAASNYAQMEGAKSVDPTMKKVWIATHDDRVRPEHLDAESEYSDGIPMNQDFYVGSSYLSQPGDPIGEAEDVINCFTEDQIVKINPRYIKKIYRSFYKGDVITFKLSNGKEFTCTPNHPILTQFGWVAAKELNSSFNLVHADFMKSLTGDFDINDIPITFKDIYNSISVIGYNVRVALINVNFYGDIPNSDVDIISTKNFLLNTYPSFTSKITSNIILKLSNLGMSSFFSNSLLYCRLMMERMRKASHYFISLLCNPSLFFKSGIFKSYQISLASIPYMKSIFANDSLNNIPRNSELFTKPKDAKTRLIQVNDFLLINRGAIRPEDMIGISVITTHDYKGFVYTLETDTQIYEVNSIIARNCRCTIAFIPG